MMAENMFSSVRIDSSKWCYIRRGDIFLQNIKTDVHEFDDSCDIGLCGEFLQFGLTVQNSVT